MPDTQVDKRLNKILNRPVIATVVVIFIIIGGIVKGIEPLETIWEWIHPKPNTDTVFVVCKLGTMPSTIPPEGRIHYLLTSELPKEMGGGGFMDSFGPPGAAVGFSKKGDAPAWAYRCDMTNNSSAVMMNVSMAIRTEFREPVAIQDQPRSRKEGNVTLDREWPVTIPKLDPGVPFTFYVWNCCVQRFVHVSLPDAVNVEEGNRKVRLVQAKDHLYQSLLPAPWPGTGKN
jgi:hypothetical protein